MRMPDRNPDILSVAAAIGYRSETWLHRQLTATRRHTVHVLTESYCNAKEYPVPHITVSYTLPHRIRRTGMRVLGLARWDKNPMGKDLRRLLGDGHFRVLQAHFGWMAAEYHDVLEADGRPFVVWLYGSDVFRAGPCRSDYLPRLFASRGRIACTSRALRNECVALGCPAEKVEVIYPGVRLCESPVPRPSNKVLRLVSVGRLVDFKEPLALVHLARRLNDKKMRYVWVHLGDGPLRPVLEHAVIALGLEQQVTLRGEVTNAEVLREIGQADVMVHRAVTAPDGGRESFGVVLVEAASRGVPVVSNPVGGIPEVVVDGVTGFLVESAHLDVMADRVLQLEASPELREAMGASARERVRECFNAATQIEHLDQFYDRLIDLAH